MFRTMFTFFALGAGAYVLLRRAADTPGTGRPAAFAADQPGGGPGPQPVRDAGPEAMRDPPRGEWSGVDEASDESFPASDPPGSY